MKFEDMENYAQWYDEIVIRDHYKLQSLIFPPNVIFDLGANIGVFTHHAHELFPNALIVAVEPHPPNFEILERFAPPGVVTLKMAIGQGPVTRYLDVQGNPTGITGGETYITNGVGYEIPHLDGHAVEQVDTPSVMLDELHDEYVRPGQRVAVKIDCEGAENPVFAHPPSVNALRAAEFVSMELHPYWMNSDSRDDPKALAERVHKIFANTHRYDSEIPMAYAWRKPDDEPIAGRGEFGKLLAERNLLGNMAEIGVASGCFSLEFLQWGAAHVLMVDPWEGIWEPYYQQALDKVRDYPDQRRILRMTSLQAAVHTPDGSLDFCYIDADHSYEAISADLRIWWRKLRSGGILAGHDYLNPAYGVNRAVTEFAAERALHVHLVIEHQNDASFWIEKP